MEAGRSQATRVWLGASNPVVASNKFEMLVLTMSEGKERSDGIICAALVGDTRTMA